MNITRVVANGEITTTLHIGSFEMFFTRPTTWSRVTRHYAKYTR